MAICRYVFFSLYLFIFIRIYGLNQLLYTKQTIIQLIFDSRINPLDNPNLRQERDRERERESIREIKKRRLWVQNPTSLIMWPQFHSVISSRGVWERRPITRRSLWGREEWEKKKKKKHPANGKWSVDGPRGSNTVQKMGETLIQTHTCQHNAYVH